jgi:histidyl-tRNA synthetase
MIPDAELLSLLCTILTRLEVGEFTIKVRLSNASLLETFMTMDRLTIEKFLMGFLRFAASHQRRSAQFRPLSTN